MNLHQQVHQLVHQPVVLQVRLVRCRLGCGRRRRRLLLVQVRCELRQKSLVVQGRRSLRRGRRRRRLLLLMQWLLLVQVRRQLRQQRLWIVTVKGAAVAGQRRFLDMKDYCAFLTTDIISKCLIDTKAQRRVAYCRCVTGQNSGLTCGLMLSGCHAEAGAPGAGSGSCCCGSGLCWCGSWCTCSMCCSCRGMSAGLGGGGAAQSGCCCFTGGSSCGGAAACLTGEAAQSGCCCTDCSCSGVPLCVTGAGAQSGAQTARLGRSRDGW